ncbi:MAG TPA: DUF4124 domain-containing protein [Arenimonas sp.]|uniref:DUF4124 domain-containing protein n=1 Tax=Arenimonas sp. TaxID=1872635 RepID=UPI002D80B23F|nr:DUF4124 domain-containing protein [Arenimonas sp.]HEU0152557.1 DUF4124 domain-containing protein [Arenimonas sp.]
MRCLTVLLLLLLVPALPARAQGVKRCTDAQGNTVFTDRACASVDAVPKGAPVPPGGATAEGFAPRGCARTAEDLLVGVRTALEARDVNRLASYYHWTGTGSGTGRQVMDELEAIATRPLVAVALAYPPTPAAPDPLLAFGPDAQPDAPAPARPQEAPEADLAAPRGQAPIGLDVEQMAGDANAASRSTRFRLHRNVGCWWLAL